MPRHTIHSAALGEKPAPAAVAERVASRARSVPPERAQPTAACPRLVTRQGLTQLLASDGSGLGVMSTPAIAEAQLALARRLSL